MYSPSCLVAPSPLTPTVPEGRADDSPAIYIQPFIHMPRRYPVVWRSSLLDSTACHLGLTLQQMRQGIAQMGDRRAHAHAFSMSFLIFRLHSGYAIHSVLCKREEVPRNLP